MCIESNEKGCLLRERCKGEGGCAGKGVVGKEKEEICNEDIDLWWLNIVLSLSLSLSHSPVHVALTGVQCQ